MLQAQMPGLMIGIPDVFGSLAKYDREPARFWRAYLATNRGWITKHLDLGRTYGNTNMTRFWSGYKKDLRVIKEILEQYRKIWDKRDIVFIEGHLTRMGVGNDLFRNARSIHRILCPAENAWEAYENILSEAAAAGNTYPETLFILALGPTATVLAYDLTRLGMQALDLGHLDIQYEYYLKQSGGKTAVEGKYVNESTDGQDVTDDILDEDYRNSILCRI